ncbi:MAG: hypothetical protein ABI480_05340, partial [Chitinophagaceae bacterium]
MRPFRLLILLFLAIPITFHAQKSLTGLWTGTLSNDSSTSRRDQSFEIALTQYKEKVYGYSRATFIVNDTLYYIVKRVKGTVTGGVCEIKDDEIISNNFLGKLDKGVKVSTTFHMNQLDSVWHLDGEWNTNKTKKFYALSGKIELKDEPDLEKSKIFPHLEELKLAKDVPFYADKKKEAAAAKSVASAPKKNDPPKNRIVEPDKKNPVKPTTQAAETTSIVKNEPKKQDPVTTTKQPGNNKPTETVTTKPETVTPPEEVATIKPVEEKKRPLTDPAANDIKKSNASMAIADQKKKTEPPPMVVRSSVAATGAAAMVTQRKTAPPQEVQFKSDSLELALYDNGEVDGDTVSVLLNGEIILARQGLKTSAIKKTIYVTPGTDEI